METQKTRTPIISKFLAFALTGVLMLALAACSGGNASADTEAADMSSAEAPLETAAPETQPPETEPVKEFYQVGETLQDGDFEITYLASGGYTYKYPEFFHPAEGNQWIFLKFRVTNLASDSETLGMDRFKCSADTTDEYIPDDFWGCTIPAGRTVTANVCFEVPEDAPKIEVEYVCDISYYSPPNSPDFNNKEVLKFLYEGEMDSGLSEAGNPEPTPDAMQVGETAEFSAFNVNYLSCYLDKSISIPAKEGYHYVTFEIEYENLSSDGLNIYGLCFADGLNCEIQTWQRKGDIKGTMPSGQKATGVWTFAVPDSAAVVEFEHVIRLAHACGDGSYTLDENEIDLVFDAGRPTE